jgi:hypothetical protein
VNDAVAGDGEKANDPVTLPSASQLNVKPVAPVNEVAVAVGVAFHASAASPPPARAPSAAANTPSDSAIARVRPIRRRRPPGPCGVPFIGCAPSL